jgi:formate C-acetyltransferase
LLSATLEGCIANGRDYTLGGAKYSPSGVALIGLGATIDSLYAIKCAVYDEGWLTLPVLRTALACNWDGFEGLRLRLQRLPKFGQGHTEVDALAARFARELAAAIRLLPNERGGIFQASFFVYYAFEWFANCVRATPDGRRDGDLLSQGIGPARTTQATLSEICETLAGIDFRDYPGNAVLDAQLPAGRIPTEALNASLRTFAEIGGPTIQLNCISVEQLRDAQRHPEQYRDLTVRICGLSAYFVSLTPHVQDEIISRALVGV